MEELFSERYGYVVKQLQFESLDKRTRDFIWEEFYFAFMLELEIGLDEDRKQAKYFLSDLNKALFSVSLIDSPTDYRFIINSCKNAFNVSKWYFIFDIIEFTIRNIKKSFISKQQYLKAVNTFTINTNRVLKDEKSTYRLVSNLIVPITNEVELTTIAEAGESQD